jgi:hypothetical protein
MLALNLLVLLARNDLFFLLTSLSWFSITLKPMFQLKPVSQSLTHYGLQNNGVHQLLTGKRQNEQMNSDSDDMDSNLHPCLGVLVYTRYFEGKGRRILVQGQPRQKHNTLSKKLKQKGMGRGATQVVEHLPSKCKAPSSISKAPQKF